MIKYESWEHIGTKNTLACVFHQLGFKVLSEPELRVGRRKVIPDLIAVKGGLAIVVEVGKLQRRPIKFKELYESIIKHYPEFKIRHVTLCNPLPEQFSFFNQIDKNEVFRLYHKITERTKPDRKLHFRD